jgi:hypothetical protein
MIAAHRRRSGYMTEMVRESLRKGRHCKSRKTKMLGLKASAIGGSP